MFRNHICTISRPSYKKVNGEIIWSEAKIIASDIPCHLSVKNLSRINQTQSTGNIELEYVLFFDTGLNLKIEPNDIVEVKTDFGNTYKLRAGESHIYNMTTQTELYKIITA